MNVRIYIDTDDRWVGWYRGVDHHYVCLVPCVVISWPRRTSHVTLELALDTAMFKQKVEEARQVVYSPCYLGMKHDPHTVNVTESGAVTYCPGVHT